MSQHASWAPKAIQSWGRNLSQIFDVTSFPFLQPSKCTLLPMPAESTSQFITSLLKVRPNVSPLVQEAQVSPVGKIKTDAGVGKCRQHYTDFGVVGDAD